MDQNLPQEPNELEAANQSAQDDVFQDYLDRISKLVVDHKLREAEPGGDLSVVARAHTLAVLKRLDQTHKRGVVEFLGESGLIRRRLLQGNKEAPRPVVSLRGADLSSAQLSHIALAGDFGTNIPIPPADLEGAILGDADLSGSMLRLARLSGADLTKANLSGAVLMSAELRRADLTGAYLTDALMDGADLRDAKVTDEQLAECRSLNGVTMPDGSKHD